ncbi:hypothetical protein [Anaerorhabdus sp.]|jgi:hypothetical protein|uniref:hypothetical protein n=1 Tax=Anaerorhabdus sp. TaxID=1872524 RepID=UPI002FCBBDE9
MKFKKIHCDDITRCYCASHIMIDGELVALFASEDPTSVCHAYSGKNFEHKEVVWDNAGGCMSIIPIPGKVNEFLAVQEFYLKVNPSLAKIVWGKYEKESGWVIKDVLHLPYIHRFDIYHKNGVNYFIGATIAEDKKDKEDWSKPGQIYVGIIPDNPTDGIELTRIVDNCYKNHGYSRGEFNGSICGYFASEQGVLRVTPPSELGGQWTTEKIMDGHISEIAFVDINNDGIDEMMTIEPFHGNSIKIYKLVNGKYECDFEYPTAIDFAHTLVGAKFCGKNSFLAGVRRVNAELFVVQYINDEYEITIVENGVGPANIQVVNRENDDIIIAANHTKNEAAIYVATI